MKSFFLLSGSFEHLFKFAGLHFNTNKFASELVDDDELTHNTAMRA